MTSPQNPQAPLSGNNRYKQDITDMDENSLGNYRSDISQLPEVDENPVEQDKNNTNDIQASMYHQELNTLKIEKLSNRITIISVIIPCIIITILAFAYLDMKERVGDVNETKGTQVELMAKKLEEKLNALDVRIAKAKFELDKNLPVIEKKSQALENQLAKIGSAKADLKAMDKAMAKLEKKIRSNAGQDKATLAAIQGINLKLIASINKNNDLFKKEADTIKDEMQLFKEEFDARLLELSVYEQQIGQLSKSTSLLDKKFKTLKQDTTRATDLRLDQLRLSLEKQIQALDSKMQGADPGKTASPKPAPKPAPQVGKNSAEKPGSQDPNKISEETLVQ